MSGNRRQIYTRILVNVIWEDIEASAFPRIESYSCKKNINQIADKNGKQSEKYSETFKNIKSTNTVVFF